MYKIINPYNKFVWEKTIKQVNTHTKYTWGRGLFVLLQRGFLRKKNK